MPKRLTTALPEDVWERFAAEAADHGQSVGAYLAKLIIKRDGKQQDRAKP